MAEAGKGRGGGMEGEGGGMFAQQSQVSFRRIFR